MRRVFYILIFILSHHLCLSQEKSVVNSYVDYFTLPRETLFLHTNKTTYMPGEEIWFKIYAYDRKSQLTSKVTTNIQLGVFDAEGRQVDHKLIRGKNGFANGNIAVDSTWVSGNYFVKISTRWMKNFGEDDSFTKKIRILNPKFKLTPTPVSKKEYDIQFLPEGGHLLAGIKNVVGVKVIDDTGKGTKASGIILNSKNEEVATFQSNFLGLGRFSLIPSSGEKYRAKVTLDNIKEVELVLPESEEKGITVQVNNLNSRDVVIDINTNDASFEQLKTQSYQLLIHKDGLTKKIRFQLNSPQERIVLSKQDLFKGINTLTLFDENNTPLVERMFFNEALIKTYAISVEKIESKEDSTVFALQANLKDSIALFTSISVLPKETKSYDPKHNILSAFYLKPYLKGSIESPSYYFTKMNRKKRYELDLLLLTQGWSRYSWTNIFNNPPQMTYPFENGFTIRGTINQDLDKIESFIMYTTTSQQTRFLDFDAKGKFMVDNVFARNGEKLYFSYVNKRGKGKRPKLAANIMDPMHPEATIDVSGIQEYQSFYANLNSIPTNFINPATEVLDEIVLQAKLRLQYIREVPFEGKIVKVTDSMLKMHRTIPDLLATIPKNGRPVLIYVDGVMQGRNPKIGVPLDYLLVNGLHNYEDVTVNYALNIVRVPFERDPIVYPVIITIKTRTSPFKDLDLSNSPYRFVEVKTGFEPAKQFYTPRYISYKIETFRDYGVIHWEPDAFLTKDITARLKMVETNLDEINFYIEGITSDGDLISQVLTIENTKNLNYEKESMFTHFCTDFCCCFSSEEINR